MENTIKILLLTALSLGAVMALQRAWRSYTNKQIFRYFRDMIKFREQGDAKLLLRCINPKEAGMIDPASADPRPLLTVHA